MKRVVERNKKLAAFSIGTSELQALWQTLLNLFDSSRKVNTSIKIELSSEELEFADVDELRQYDKLPEKITQFSIHLSQDLLTSNARIISIRSSALLGSRPVAHASAQTEAWCAGAIEVVNSFVQSHRAWYSWLVPAPLGGIIFVLWIAPNIVSIFIPKEIVYTKNLLAAWFLLFLALSILYFGRNKLLPPAMLRIREEEGFLRKHLGELSLLVAFLGLLLAIIQFFTGK